MKVFLVGYMGVGKTRLGAKLAKHLNLAFYDLDQIIVDQEGSSIPEIFEKDGEVYFRKIEALALRKFSNLHTDFLLSTGGGVPMHSENMAFINQTGISICLEMSPKMIFDRLKKKREKRPLIAGKSDDELLEFIRESLSQREQYYNLAHIKHEAMDSDSKSLEELAKQVENYSK